MLLLHALSLAQLLLLSEVFGRLRRQRTHEARGSYCLYANGFRFYFTPLSGVLFAFPSRYWFTIGQSRVFSLGGWSPLLQTGFLVSRLTLRYPLTIPFTYRAITCYGDSFQSLRLNIASLM
jgi:hypothetical protein